MNDRGYDRPRIGGKGTGAAGWGWLALPGLLVLCCALPLLLGSLGTAAAISLWARGYGYAALGLLAVSVLTLLALRAIRQRRMDTRPGDATGIPAADPHRARYRAGP